MYHLDSDSNLLFGVVALQLDFITRDQLIDGMNAWAIAKSKPLGEILRERGALDAGDRSALEDLVRRHIRRHGGDPEKSLAAIKPMDSDRAAIEREVSDADLHESLGRVSAAGRGEDHEPTTRYTSFGERTSAGTRFRILRPHAQGGLGIVSVAIDEELDRTVALKEIREQHADEPENRARFVLEAEITGKMEHPGIIPIYGFGHDPTGRPYYAMRFVRGDSLKEAIRRFHGGEWARGPGRHDLAFRELLGRFLDVCDAVDYAHSRGVVHRDLKPENVMLGPFGETLVVDWGLARACGPADGSPDAGAFGCDGPLRLKSPVVADTSGMPIGTSAYMSPEQAEGRVDDIGRATDVFGLGAILYCLLTARAPIEGRDRVETLRRARLGDIPKARLVKPGVPPALGAICRKAMAAQAADRYPSARDLAADVKRWLADEPTTVFRDRFAARASRWVRRHKTAVVGMAALLLTAVAALGISNVLIRREAEQTRLALGDSNESFKLATDAVASSLRDIASVPLAAVPYAEGLRLRMAEEALRFNEEFLRRRPNDPIVMDSAAGIYREAANLHRMLGDPVRAARFYDRSRSLLERLVANYPRDMNYADHLALLLIDQGENLRKAGRPEESEPPFRRATQVAGRLRRDHPNEPGFMRTQALCELDLAESLSDIGRFDKAAALCGDAIEFLNESVPGPGATPSRRGTPFHPLLLAMAYSNLGRALRGLGEFGPAARETARAIEIVRLTRDEATKARDVGRDPYLAEAIDINASKLEAIFCIEQGANLAATPSRLPASERYLDRSIDALERLSVLYANTPDYRELLASALDRRGLVRQAQGRYGPASEDFRRARALAEGLTARPEASPAHRGLLGRILGHAGRMALARGDREEAVEPLRRAVAELARSLEVAPGHLENRRERDEDAAALAQAAP